MTMNEPHPEQVVLGDLVARLQLCVASEDKAYGEVCGSPITMTVLGMEPLALLAGFKIQFPHPSQIELPDDIAALVSRNQAEVSLEHGIAWLTLKDLSGQTSEALEGLITTFAQALSQAEVRVPNGCVKCRSLDDVALVYSDGHCSRLCVNCRARIVVDRSQREAELNRPSVLFALALPLLFLSVACTGCCCGGLWIWCFSGPGPTKSSWDGTNCCWSSWDSLPSALGSATRSVFFCAAPASPAETIGSSVRPSSSLPVRLENGCMSQR